MVRAMRLRAMRFLPPVSVWLAAALLASPVSARAGLQVLCELAQGGETWQLRFDPTATPYEAVPVDLHGLFRFKVVVLGTPEAIAHVTLSSQYLTARQPMPLHQATFVQPRLPAGVQRLPLGGRQVVVSPRLGRELQYDCALVEAAP